VRPPRPLATLGLAVLLAAPAAARPKVKELIARFKAASGDERVALAEALGRTQDKAAVDALMLAFDVRKGSPREMTAIAEGLGRAGDSRASAELAAADDYLRSAAVEMSGLTPALEALRVAVLGAAGRCSGPASVRLLESALNDDDPRVVVEAERGLGRLRVTDALAMLEQMASSGGDQAQAAIEALADIGDKRAVSTIENGLASSDKFIEIESSYALARLGEDGMIERLEAMLKVDPGAERVGLVAAYYLVRLDRASGLSHLETLLKGEDVTYAVLAADMLGKSSNPKAVPLLIQAAGSDEPTLRVAIARSLGLLGGPRAVLELKKLRADTNEPVRSAALSALAELGELD